MNAIVHQPSSRPTPNQQACLVLLMIALTLACRPVSGAFISGWGANNAQQIEPPLWVTNAVSVSAGAAHAVALLATGEAIAWGNNDFGQTAIPSGTGPFVSASSGFRHSLGLRADGSIVAWGENSLGQASPPAGTNYVAIAAGGSHSLALRKDGTVVAWGSSLFGQTGVPPLLESVRGIAAGGYHSIAVQSNGTVFAWGLNNDGQRTVPAAASNVVAVAAGYRHSLALRNNGTVVAWGSNAQGQRDVPVGLTNVVAIAAGRSQSLALCEDGTITVWGETAGGVLDPEGLTQVQAIAAGGDFNLTLVAGPAVLRQPESALIVPGTAMVLAAYVAGSDSMRLQWQRDGVNLPAQTNLSLILSNTTYADFGDYRLRVDDGPAVVFSQVARLSSPPSIIAQPQPVGVFYGDTAMFEVTATGSAPLAYRWYRGSSPVASATNSSLILSNVTYTSAGSYFVVLSNAWGAVTSPIAALTVLAKPNLGIESYSPDVPFDGSYYISARASGSSPDSYQWQLNGMDLPGENQSALIVTNARPAMGGIYRYVGTTRGGTLYSPEVSVTVGRAHPVNYVGRTVILDAGTAWGLARGFRWFHEGVELPGQTNSTLRIEALEPSDAGDYAAAVRYEAGEQMFDVARVTVLPAPPAGNVVLWGSPQFPQAELLQMQDVVGIAVGAGFVLTLQANGKVSRWGSAGQTSWPSSLEPTVGISAKDSQVAGLASTGKAGSDTWNYCDPCPALTTNWFVQVAMGDDFAIGLREDGTAVTWGITGAVNPMPSGLQRLVAVAAGVTYAVALKNDGTVFAWGSNYYGETNVPTGLAGVKSIACGWHHCLALKSNGVVVAWGNNASRQCNVPAGLAGVVAIGAGASESFAVRSNGTVAAWGDNTFGQCDVPAGLTGVTAVAGWTSISAALVGSPARPAILDHPVGGTRELGQSFEFGVHAWSTEPLTYQWQHSGTNIPGAEGASLVLTNVQLMDAGEYRVAVSTSAGTAISDAAILYVNRQPFLSLPPTRGHLVVWPGQYYSVTAAIPGGLGEVAAISAGPMSPNYGCAIGSDGAATIWSSSKTNRLAETNLISVVPWHDSNFNEAYLGLGANGVVEAWLASSLAVISAPAGLRDVVQLVGGGSGAYIAVHEDGTLQHSFAADFFPTNLSNVVQAACGQYHAVALRADGTAVMSKIDNPSSQTPAPTGLTNVVQVAAGAEHTLALLADSTVVAWGRTNEGQCLVPVGLTNVTAVAAGAYFSMALREDGTVAVWGDSSHNQTLLPPGLTNVAAIAASYSGCLAIQRGPLRVSGPEDLTIAPGQVGTFEVVAQGSPSLNYQWSFAGEPIAGATNSVLQVAAGSDTEGLYSVKVSNSQGSFSASAMLWQAVPPEILVQPNNAVVATGGSWTFMVLASGLAPLRYQWQANGTNIVGATNSTYTVTSATASRAGIYVVTVANDFGTTSSEPVLLTVMSPPLPVIQPVSLTRAEGETARFTAVTSGGQPQSVQWFFGGMPLLGETNAVLEIPGITPSYAGSYSVRVSNAVATQMSQNALLTVVGRAPVIAQTPVDQTAHFGDTVSFTVVATGASPLQYQWWHDGVPIGGANSNALNLTRVDRGDQGAYGVVVWNDSGSVTSAPSAQLTLTIGPNVVVWGTNTLAQAVPSDLTNAIAVAASSHVLALRSDGTITAWGLNDYGQATVPAGLSNVVAVAVGSATSLALKSNGQVVAWGYDFGGWGLTNVPANLTNAVGIAAGSLHSVALRSDGTVAGWGYNSYGQASPPAGLSNVVGLTANSGATVALKADTTVTHWGNGYFGGDSLTNIMRVMGRGRMLALRTDNRVVGWGWTTGASVEGPPGIVFADSYTVPFKQGNTTYLETHEIGLLTNGMVAVWGTNRGGIFNPPALSNVVAISAGYFFNVAVVGGPVILRQPVSQTVTAGADVTFTVEAMGCDPLSYQWRFNGLDLPGKTNASLTIQSATAAHTGQYEVRLADPTGWVISRAATVLVVTPSPYILRQPNDYSVTEGAGVSFTVEAVGVEPLWYQWLHNGSPVPGGSELVLTLPSTSAGDAGFYSVVVWNSHGVATSSSAVLTLGLPDFIVDNTNAVVSGTWESGSKSGQIGTNYLFIRSGFGANEVRFVPNLPRAGRYQVWTRGLSGSTFTPGFLIVNHSGGASGVAPANASGWCGLGTYSFASGSSGSVVVSDDFAMNSAVEVADAILFRYVPSPPVITRQPADIQVVEGADATLSLVAGGAVPLICQWQFNGTNLPGAIGQVITLNAIDRVQAGKYRALLSNTDGSILSREVSLSVVAPELHGSIQDGMLLLNWDGSATLETSTDAAGPYSVVPGAQPPLLIEPAEAHRFFRLVR